MDYNRKPDQPIRRLDEISLIAAELTEAHGPYRVALAVGQDLLTISGLALGREKGLIEPMLIGHKRRISEALEKLGLNNHDWLIYSEKDHYTAAQKAAKLVTSGMADILMRGKLHARDFFRALLDPAMELRQSGDLWSSIVVFELEGLERLLLLTDPSLVSSADLTRKLKVIQNATEFAGFLGISEPKVALLAAVESITPGMPVSLEEAAIAKMSERGQFADGVLIDGPLSLDLSISPESVKKKGIKSPVAGMADILVVNNIHIGNVLFKSLVTLCEAKSASTIIGPPFPTILTSRSESPENILYSIALAIMQVGPKNND